MSMTNITELTAKLKAAVHSATPGPWLWINNGSCFSFLVSESNQDPHARIIDDGSAWGEYGETIDPESPDGIFIALANPANLQALIEALEAAEKRIAELEARTLTVKLPDYRDTYKEAFASEVEHHVRIELGKLAAAAGIKLQIEGE